MSDFRTASEPWQREPEGPRMSEREPEGASTGEPEPPAPVLPGEQKRRKKSRTMRAVIEWGVIIAVALLGAVLIRTVLFQAFFIPSASMDPTLKVHDRILVNKLSYHMHPVHRGDIVVFKRSANMPLTEGNIKDLVKRVIGLPGETISSTPSGQIEINGQVLQESYLPPGTALGQPIKTQTIPSGHYFVMGDNRTDSSDSRVFGPIARSQIIGRAFILIWPLSDFKLL
jgi:signal peptidase I